MNNKGFMCEKTKTKMVAIREEDLDTLLKDLAETIVMVQGLAALIEKEEKLKQHHRPYLDVRKEMIETAGAYLERLEEMDKAIDEMPYGCDLDCFENCPRDSSDVKEDEENEFEEEAETMLDFLDDLAVLADYLAVQRCFAMLAEHGIPANGSWKAFYDAMFSDLDYIVERWGDSAVEILANFCI
jgi:hypothetical protein